MEKLMTLEEWARSVYGENPPSIKTLYRWIHEARLHPPAEKQGRSYYVLSSARYFDPTKPTPRPANQSSAKPRLVERIRRGA